MLRERPLRATVADRMTLLVGTLLNPSLEGARVTSPGYVSFDPTIGTIRDIGPWPAARPVARESDYRDCLLVPGFVDVHCHVPQHPIAGLGRGELLPWLKDYVAPAEAAFSDPMVAERVSRDFFSAHVRAGTTTFVAYGNNDAGVLDVVFRQAIAQGVRLAAGQAIMEYGFNGEIIRTREQIVSECKALIARWHRPPESYYVLTPRFALSCSKAVLHEVGRLYRETGVYLQTHLAENRAEIAEVRRRFPEQPHYTGVYGACGLLGPRTVLAHCIHLNETELALLQDTGSRIAHCPSANRFLGSGIMPLKRYLEKGLIVGLGTDIGAGYFTSMLDEAREALEQSKQRKLLSGRDEAVSVDTVFYLATLGGAKVLGLEQRIGSLAVGKDADLVVIRRPERVTQQDLAAALVYTCRCVNKVYGRGRLLYDGQDTL